MLLILIYICDQSDDEETCAASEDDAMDQAPEMSVMSPWASAVAHRGSQSQGMLVSSSSTAGAAVGSLHDNDQQHEHEHDGEDAPSPKRQKTTQSTIVLSFESPARDSN